MVLYGNMSVKEKNSRLRMVNVHTSSFAEEREDGFKSFCIFDSGGSMQHGVINKLLVRGARYSREREKANEFPLSFSFVNDPT